MITITYTKNDKKIEEMSFNEKEYNMHHKIFDKSFKELCTKANKNSTQK